MKKKISIALAIVFAICILLFTVFTFSFQGAPYTMPASPVVAYRITGQEGDGRYFANDPQSLHGYAIVQQQVITDPQLQHDVADLLNGSLIYGPQGFQCFEPGIAIRVGEGPDPIDVLICLHCEHIYFFHGGHVTYRNLNFVGVARIESLYARLFPGHSPDNSDEDAQRVTESRTKERDRRREQEWNNATTQPATSQPTTFPTQ